MSRRKKKPPPRSRFGISGGRDAVVDRMAEIHEQAGDRALTDSEQEEFEYLVERVDEYDRLQDLVDRGSIEVGTDFDTGGLLHRGDPWAPSDGRETTAELRGKALTAIEKWPADDELKEAATHTIESRVAEGEEGKVAEHLIKYSDPLYCSAFRKWAGDPETYVASLTEDERRVWAANRTEARATLQTSGSVLPSPLDPSIVMINTGVSDPMRQVARVVTTTSKTQRFITSAGSSFSFDAELAEVSDDTPTLSEITITNRKAQGYIEASIEAWQDTLNFDSEVVKIIADGKARLEGLKWIKGLAASNEPIGLEGKLTGGASEDTAAGETLVAQDIYDLIESLSPRYRDQATWMLEYSTLNKIARMWNPSGSEPPLVEGTTILRRPYVLNSSIDPFSAVNAAATATHRTIIVGDFRHYVITDRVGMSVSFQPPGILRAAANNRPDGRVSWYAWWRTGADALSIAPFRMSKIVTTA